MRDKPRRPANCDWSRLCAAGRSNFRRYPFFGELGWTGLWAAWLVACVVAAPWGPARAADKVLSFNQTIRPILADNCFACHGPAAADRAADLRLDDAEAARAAGAVAPGKPDESLLVERITSKDPDLRMPPPDSGKELNAAEKEQLIQWIQQGAEYQRHWSFEPPPARTEAPTVQGHRDWPRKPTDRFVLRRLEEKGWAPSAEADRGTWLRRVTYDLTGLPPTLDELRAFTSDMSKDAYEKVVERLLQSEAYAERMANMWLDVARYADTFGYQNDVAMEVWPWRDWVIDAFRRNLPYDEFIVEQLAGDLLPDATVDQRLATTFNRLHRQTNEGGSIAEEFRINGVADRTTTAGTAFLGLTLECCRCHDHKFDPVAQKEFYQLSAFFADIDEFGLYSHFTYAAPTPAMPLYAGDQQERHEAAKAAVVQAERELADALSVARARLKEEVHGNSHPLVAAPMPTLQMSLEGEHQGVVGKATACDGDREIKCDEAPEFGRTDPFAYSLWVRPAERKPRMIVLHQSRAAEDAGFRGIQLTLDDGRPEFSMIHFWPGNAVRIRSKRLAPTGKWTHVAVTHDGSGRAAGLRLFVNGRPTEVEVIRDKLTRDVRHRKEWGDMAVGGARLALGARFRDIGFRGGLLDELAVFTRQLSTAEVMAVYREGAGGEGDGAPPMIDMRTAIEHQLLTQEPAVAAARRRLREARQKEDDIYTQVRMIMTMEHDEQAPVTHFLERGDYRKQRDVVQPATPSFTGALAAQGSDRLALARWMVDERHPLTARVMANRMWHLFFGRGLVVTLEDFGSQGAPPSHPDLIDYLAKSFMDHDWDLHWLCREITLSATYRQSSKPDDPSLFSKDPDNTWLGRGPKHRLSAEQLRDTALAVSGLLVRTVGGPSVMPYQPPGLWREAGTGKSYRQATGDGLYRRSLYTFWKRTAPPPSMITFDATNREYCTPRRELTTTPLQALVLLNDPQFVEASRVLADGLVDRRPDDLDARWNELFLRLLSRKPTTKELRVFEQLYAEQRQVYEANPERAKALRSVGQRPALKGVNPVDAAATTIVVQTLLAYDETMMLR